MYTAQPIKPQLGPSLPQPMELTPTDNEDVAYVSSERDPMTLYRCHLVHQTCTCPDWEIRRSAYPVGDEERLCKHLIFALMEPLDIDFSPATEGAKEETPCKVCHGNPAVYSGECADCYFGALCGGVQ